MNKNNAKSFLMPSYIPLIVFLFVDLFYMNENKSFNLYGVDHWLTTRSVRVTHVYAALPVLQKREHFLSVATALYFMSLSSKSQVLLVVGKFQIDLNDNPNNPDSFSIISRVNKLYRLNFKKELWRLSFFTKSKKVAKDATLDESIIDSRCLSSH